VIFSAITGPKQQYLVLGAVCAVLSVLPLYWCFGNAIALPLLSHNAVTLKSFRILPFTATADSLQQPTFSVCYRHLSCSWLGVQITAAIIPFGQLYELEDKDVPSVIIAVQGTVMLLYGSYISKRVGKSCLFYGNEPLDYGAGGTFFSSSQGKWA